MIKVKMLPTPDHFRSWESGIKQVVIHYFKHLPRFDIELCPPDATTYDLVATHAGEGGAVADVAHCHGLYWTADYNASAGEYETNRNVIEAVRNAKEVTVPSPWVAEPFQRDMRFSPHIIPHGIEWQEWQHTEEPRGYALFNKNALGGWVDFGGLKALAQRFPETTFVSTFEADNAGGIATGNTDITSPKTAFPNIQVSGMLPHDEMKLAIQRSSVYLSLAKETFCIGALEAMAAGRPVLGFANGGNLDLVKHGETGYLARPGDYEDLVTGLDFCLGYQKVLGENGREVARGYTWGAACEMVAGVYRLAMEEELPTVDVIIPVFNKTTEQVVRAIQSAGQQTHKPGRIIVVDDGSTNETIDQLELSQFDFGMTIHRQSNQGVAHARNKGIALGISKYVCCLDSDDWISPTFLETCVNALEKDDSLGLAYTGLRGWWPDGASQVGDWPGVWDYDAQINYRARLNQPPTCNVFRRKVWGQLGGYRQKYGVGGAGEEDAEFWTRIGAYGWKCAKVTEEALFNYSYGGSVSGDPDHIKTDWLINHPWAQDGQHPFSSYATPKRQSHPVRQYDEPVISVIIPVGPGHEKTVIDALDSLEAQTFRKWEAIVVWDNFVGDIAIANLLQSYPYIKFINIGNEWGNLGPGYARNRGVEIARAPFITFLDADDNFLPDFLQTVLDGWSKYKTAIYTDYGGQTFSTEEVATKLRKEKKLIHYNPVSGEILMHGGRIEFDCARAQRQPNLNEMYIWNLVSTLYPRSWHDEIGGFDEEMDTWEDWDYSLRMVHKGHCFTRIPEELVRYRFHTGLRRDQAAADTEEGRQKAQAVVKYLETKYEDIEKVADCGCPGRKQPPSPQKTAGGTAQQQVMRVADDDFVKCRYTGRRGNHHVIGQFRFSQDPGVTSRGNPRDGYRIVYGLHICQGYECPVHKKDIHLMVGKWQPLEQAVALPDAPPLALPQPIAASRPQPVRDTQDRFPPAPSQPIARPPKPVAKQDVRAPIYGVSGISDPVAFKLEVAKITTPEQLNGMSVDDLMGFGVGEDKARIILEYAAENYGTVERVPVPSLEKAITTGFGMERYSKMKATELIGKLSTLTNSELQEILELEQGKSKPRKTVIRAIEGKLKDD